MIKDDWIIGTESLKKGSKLIYAMKIKTNMFIDDYFKNAIYELKKPKLNKTWKEACGDNIYFKDQLGNWKRIPSPYHNSDSMFNKDTKNPYVYISDYFYYFGENAIPIDSPYQKLINNRHGCKCKHDEMLVETFIDWLENNHKPGVHGVPRERERECVRKWMKKHNKLCHLTMR